MSNWKEIEPLLRKLLNPAEKIIEKTMTDTKDMDEYVDCHTALLSIREIRSLLNNKKPKSKWIQTEIPH